MQMNIVMDGIDSSFYSRVQQLNGWNDSMEL